MPFKEFVKTWNKSEPPDHFKYFGSWGEDNSVLYIGSRDKKRDANKPAPNYMPHPKDVKIEQLEARIAELENRR